QEARFTWHSLGSLTVQPGAAYQLELDAGSGLNAVNTLAFVPHDQLAQATMPREAVLAGPPALSWERVSTTRYEVTVTGARAPFLLMLHEHFDPQWVARVGGETIRPVLTAGVSNGYAITTLGSYPITLEYSGQRYYDLGLVISVVAGLVTLAYVLRFRLPRLTQPGTSKHRPSE
ncbi:MAG: hypothetical protein CL878_12290, partial [Dehalococcoidia bacterium]|nr:hypothetical protein [Dehalococcoidia bacterium]